MAEGMEKVDFKDFLNRCLKVADNQFYSDTEEFKETQVFFQAASFGEQITCNIVWRVQ